MDDLVLNDGVAASNTPAPEFISDGLVLYDGIACSYSVVEEVVPVDTSFLALIAATPGLGSVEDFATRLLSLLPRGWFADVQGIIIQGAGTLAYSNLKGGLGTLIQGPATAFSWIYNLIRYVADQTRRITISDGFLDLGIFDFFGLRIRRKPSQTDDSAREMWKQEVLRRRNTRAYVQQAIEDLTGTPVKIFEAFNPQDTGGFGSEWALNEPRSAWGSTAYPYTMFITAVQPIGAGIPNISGLNDDLSGFGAGQFALADLSLFVGDVTNSDIYDMINATRSAGVTCWVNIGPPEIVGGRLDSGFYLDSTPFL